MTGLPLQEEVNIFRESFERGREKRTLDKYDDLECVLLDVPLGTYKNELVQIQWSGFLRMMLSGSLTKYNVDGSTEILDSSGITRVKLGKI